MYRHLTHHTLTRSLIAGAMWFTYDGQFNVRHTCEHGDHLHRYGWIRHDGTSFGQQEIVDNSERDALTCTHTLTCTYTLTAFTLRTEFLTLADPHMGDTWTARFVGESRISRPQLVSFLLYVYNEGQGEMAFVTSKRNTIEEVYGHTPEVRV